MTGADSVQATADQKPPTRVEAEIQISPSGVVVNGAPVEVAGDEQWLAAGIRATAEQVATPAGRPVRARVVNGQQELRVVVHPDGTTSELRRRTVPAWLWWLTGGRADGARVALLVATAAFVVIALVAAMAVASGAEPDDDSDAAPAPPTPTATDAATEAGEAASGDVEPSAKTEPVAIRARVNGGELTIDVRVTATPKAELRWVLRAPGGRRLADRVIEAGSKPFRFSRTVPRAGDYRWSLVPVSKGPGERGVVAVAAPAVETAAAPPADPEPTYTPPASQAPPPTARKTAESKPRTSSPSPSPTTPPTPVDPDM